MQRMEKMAWNSEGARQAHVDAQEPVPRVIPAASRAPTLRHEISNLFRQRHAEGGVLIEIIQQPHAPGPISTSKGLAKIHTARDS